MQKRPSRRLTLDLRYATPARGTPDQARTYVASSGLERSSQASETAACQSTNCPRGTVHVRVIGCGRRRRRALAAGRPELRTNRPSTAPTRPWTPLGRTFQVGRDRDEHVNPTPENSYRLIHEVVQCLADAFVAWRNDFDQRNDRSPDTCQVTTFSDGLGLSLEVSEGSSISSTDSPAKRSSLDNLLAVPPPAVV